jgi:hypothetical protein
MPQYGNSVSQNGMCNAGEIKNGENMLFVIEKIQPEMHLLGPNRGRLMQLTKYSAVGAGKT